MAEATTTAAAPTSSKVTSRRKLRALSRKKRASKIVSDKEFAKSFFEAKSKRSTDKKAAYKKRHAKK
jgi:hypothetical protein